MMIHPNKCILMIILYLGGLGLVKGQSEISLDSPVGTPGSTINMTLALSANTSGVAFQGNINFDSSYFSLKSVTPKFGIESHGFSWRETSPGVILVVFLPRNHSLPLSLIPSSLLINLSMEINANTPLNTYPISFSQVVFSDANGDAVPSIQLANGSVTVGTEHSPNAVDSWALGDEDTVLNGTFEGYDVDPGTLTFSLIQDGTLGFAVITDANQGSFAYTPQSNLSGRDQLLFRVNDGSFDSPLASMTITIQPINDPPTFTETSISTLEDQVSSLVSPSMTDVDLQYEGDTFQYSMIEQPNHGIASVQNNKLRFTPQPDFSGDDSFSYRSTDSGGLFVDGIASITVDPVNDPPTGAQAFLLACIESASQPISPIVEDVDLDYEGDQYFFSILSQPSFGLASVDQNQLLYSATSPGYFGVDQFDFRVTDLGGYEFDGIADVIVTGLYLNSMPAKAQGLLPITLSVLLECGDPDYAYEWLDTLTGLTIGYESSVLIDPIPIETTIYSVTVMDNVTRDVVTEYVTLLVNPFGLDLNGDEVNDINDLKLVLPHWRNRVGDYDSNQDGVLNLIDLFYINLGE